MTASLRELYEAIDGTWPAKEFIPNGPWTVRIGDGGGKRVSATTASAKVTEGDISLAEGHMASIGQDPLFMLREGEAQLDLILEERGYYIEDPVTLYSCVPEQLMDVPIPRVTVFDLWEPLAIMTEIWATGGIGPARRRVMARVPGPKTALLSRLDDKPAGVAFAAVHNGVAMVHAVEVVHKQRRKGAAGWMMRAAAHWADRQNAHTLAVLCTNANTAANNLYRALGFSIRGTYHYRLKPKETE